MNTSSASLLPVPLKPSRYDYVSSLLVALLIMVGFFVTVMGLIWWTSLDRAAREPDRDPPTKLTYRRSASSSGQATSLDEPNRHELDELNPPQVEQTLAAVTHLISRQAATLESLGAAEKTSGDDGDSDGRLNGPPGLPAGAAPRWDRWRIQYNTSSLDAYARQLDRLGVELGAVGGGRSQVDYARQFAEARPRRRSGTGDAEKRLYFCWIDGKLKAFDRRLMTKAGVPLGGRLTLQFIPKTLEAELAKLEQQFAGKRSIRDVKQTVFAIRDEGSQPEFYVRSMQFRGKSD